MRILSNCRSFRLDSSHLIKRLVNYRKLCNHTDPSSKVRLRFAPSPTGFMHIGGVRTALINYLFAKKYDGDFILRIEDTDRKRVVEGAIENIQQVLEWFDTTPDEGPFKDKGYGPYYQSLRKELYKKYAYELLDRGLAYRCFCDETLLKLLRDQALKSRNIIGYDNRCRNLSKEQIEQNLADQVPYSIRFKLFEGETRFIDMVKDEVCVNLSQTEPDFVILKTDQYPTYHLANVIDDHLMKITHVVRGMEWLASTPKHLMLYKAFDWPAPKYAHLPLIRNPSGTKISKRNEDMNIINLKKNGIFKEAILNYLVSIGGGFKTDYTKNNDRIYDLEYFKKDFDENLLKPKSATLDLKKIAMFNYLTMKHYFEHKPEELVDKFRSMILNDFKNADENQLKFDPMCRLIRQLIIDKVHTYQELKREFAFFWTLDFERDESVKIGFDINPLKTEIIELFEQFDEITQDSFVQVKAFCKEKDLPYGPFLQLIRHSITGKIHGPKISELFVLLTKELFLKRLDDGLDKIQRS